MMKLGIRIGFYYVILFTWSCSGSPEKPKSVVKSSADSATQKYNSQNDSTAFDDKADPSTQNDGASPDEEQEDASPAPTTCKKGYYCGENGISGDRHTLYFCPGQGAKLKLVKMCKKGCFADRPGNDDYCVEE